MTYGFRYRALNAYGWGDWSPVTYFLAATIPAAPPVPTYTSASDSSISMNLYMSSDDGGDTITDYELFMDDGTNSWTIVTNYVTNSLTMTHTVSTTDNGLIAGTVYYFKWRAMNAFGYSDYSDIMSAAAVDPPATASTPTYDASQSSKNKLFIEWAKTADGQSPAGEITGY